MKKLLILLFLCAGMALSAQNSPLEITAPNGGEQWQAGTTQDITWVQQNLAGPLSIHLISPNASQPPVAIAMNVPVQAQVFHWQIPVTIASGTYYLIRISLAGNAGTTIFDVSDAPFSILGNTPPPPPPQQMITVLSPNGGEQWTIGSTHNITWSSQGLDGEVVITLVQDNGTAGYQIATQVPIQSGSYSWTIPDAVQPGYGYRIHVMWLSILTVYFGDLSDAPFSINGSDPPPPPPQWLNLLSPNGGETWVAGTMHPITWVQALNAIHPLTIELYNGLNSTVPPILIAAGIPSFPSQFNWMIPANLMPSDQYYIRISTPLADGTAFGDFSDAPFSIMSSNPPPPPQTYINVLNPNGGEIWSVGSTQIITWNSQNLEGEVVISLVQANGVVDHQIATQVPIHSGSYSWTIPNTILPGNGYRVHVMWLSDLTVYFGDVSDAPFSIVGSDPPPHQVFYLTSPNGGETWVAGTMHPITWVPGFNAIWPISLMLYNGMDPNSAPIPIAVDIPSFPSVFHWMIPADLMPSNQCFIQISTTLPDGMLLSDFSDGPFSIVAPNPPPPNQILQIISPNGGENWMAGTIHPIRWIGHQVQGPFELALMRGDSVQPALVIAPGIPNLGFFRWQIPLGLEPANDYRMRIRQLNGNLIDLSDAPFTIFANQPPPPSSVTLITPNGGESWAIGSTHTIVWTAPDLNVPMQIWLLRENQRDRWRHIITPNTPNTGSFAWTIPARVPPGDNYRILVRALHPAWQMDVSDTLFSIVSEAPKLKVAASPGGQSVSISLQSKQSVTGSVQVYNLRGQKVKDLGTLSLDSAHSVIWDARDGQGRKVGPGLYLVKVKTAMETLTARVMLGH